MVKYIIQQKHNLLLLGDTDGATSPASGLGMLTADTDTPVVTQTTMGTDLLQALQILTKLVVQKVRKYLRGLTVLNVLLPVKEVVWDLVLAWVADDGDDLLDLILCQFTSALAHIDVSLLQGDVGKATAHTLDGGNGEHGVPLTLQVGVHHTENVLEVFWNYQSHFGSV